MISMKARLCVLLALAALLIQPARASETGTLSCPDTYPHMNVLWQGNGLLVHHCTGKAYTNLYLSPPSRPDSWYFTGSYGRDDEILLSNHGDAYLIPKPGGTLILWTGYYEFSRVTIPWPHSIHLPTIEK